MNKAQKKSNEKKKEKNRTGMISSSNRERTKTGPVDKLGSPT